MHTWWKIIAPFLAAMLPWSDYKHEWQCFVLLAAGTVTGGCKQQPQRSSPPGLSHTCTPPPPSLSSPRPGLHIAEAQWLSELWKGHSGSRGPDGGRPPSQDSGRQTPPRTGQRGSCTGRSTACCTLSLFGIHLPSHAGRKTERAEFGINKAAALLVNTHNTKLTL